MSTFDQSQWADSTFAREYLDDADHYIPERHALFRVLRSFYRAFVARPGGAAICDLGCGDGILTAQLLQHDATLTATLVDGSAEMQAAARRSLAGKPNFTFIRRGFEELLLDSSALAEFDLVMSGFAIHHLHRVERRALFKIVHRHLKPGGHFLNIDVALAELPAHAAWHYQLWREWILSRGEHTGLGDKFAGVPDKARANPDNKYSPLGEQLADLRDAGFEEVECHHRSGCFAIYSARRPA